MDTFIKKSYRNKRKIKKILPISGEDGVIGKDASPPGTTIAKTTLDYKTNITQKCQKIKLCGTPTTKDLKKSHSSGQVRGAEMQRGAEMWNGWSHIYVWWIKIGRDILGARDPSPRPDHPAQGSSDRKISPHNFWL